MRLRPRRTDPTLCTLLTGLLAHGGALAAEPKSAGLPARVVVQGAALLESALAAGGQIEVLRRADLVKFGQGSLGEALARSGTIAIVAGRNGAQEITLSGLGDGYTQILLDGSKVPRGFSLDALSVDAIERVEIARTASAEAGARGIAGTINIVLKKASTAKRTAGLKASASGGWIDGHALDGSFSTVGEAGSFSLQASERRTEVLRTTRSELVDRGPDGRTVRKDELSRGPATAHDQSLAPKAEWRGEQRSLALEGLHQRSRQQRRSDFTRTSGDAPPSSGATTSRIGRDAWSTTALYREEAWLADSELEAKLSIASTHRLSEGQVLDSTAAPDAREREVRYPSHDRTFGARLRAQSKPGPLGRLALGLQYDRLHRSEEQTVVARTRTHASFEIENTDVALFANWTRKLAAGDELQVGLRHERTAFGYREDEVDAPARRFAFWIPQAAWTRKMPDGGPTLNVAMSRSIRIPDEADFSSRTYLAVFNGPSSPNQRGNPSLRPETATTLEVGAALPKGAPVELKASLAYKRLAHVIAQELLQDGGAWVQRPSNVGAGRLWVSNLTLRRPFTLPTAGGVKGSASLSLGTNGSSIEFPDGARSRLPNAAPYQLGIGTDLQAGGELPWSAGLQWTHRAASTYRLLGGASATVGARRTLDLYATARFSQALMTRLTLTNLVQRIQRRGFIFDGADHDARADARASDGLTVRLALEFAL